MSEPSQASRAARRGALIVEESDRGTLVVTGPERYTWLNGLVTCDAAALSPGKGAWGLFLTKQGKVQSDVVVVAGEEALYLSVAADRAAQLFETLDRFLIMEDAELFERSNEQTWLSLHGPRAFELASAVVPATGGVLAAVDPTGLGGAAVVVPRAAAAATLQALLSAGGFDVARAEPADWAELRIERGVPVFGVDYTSEDNPHEASLDRKAVSWTKGCYLGQEVVCMQDMRGRVKRRLVTLSVEDGPVPEPGTPVSAGNEGVEVGQVTSAVASSRLGRPVVMARVLTKLPEPCGTYGVGGRAAELLDEST
jgi:hypothetical protein